MAHRFIVGETIENWEKERPAQAKLTDPKTGEQIDYLFAHRSKTLGMNYLNTVLIPSMCAKAGLPRD